VDEINWIADFSSGDPAQVNRLSRLMLELTGTMSGSDRRGDSTFQQAPSPSAPRWRRVVRRPVLIGILLCLGLTILSMLAGRPEFGGRVDAPAQSGGDGTLAPAQVPVSPPAVVPSAAETAPNAALAAAEFAPPADPTAAPASVETAPPADPIAAPASAETAPSGDPTAAPAAAETAPPADQRRVHCEPDFLGRGQDLKRREPCNCRRLAGPRIRTWRVDANVISRGDGRALPKSR
jgi:hypothetical protein